jgi:hypothetical protein
MLIQKDIISDRGKMEGLTALNVRLDRKIQFGITREAVDRRRHLRELTNGLM